jgi:lipopolysaccharide/colanic/teichoic acid biosynthesis glycosyltransferase
MTGLRQVSGRSGRSRDEAVRLDLRCVENWSFSLDCVILLRTLSAVCRSSGAYWLWGVSPQRFDGWRRPGHPN